MDPETAPSIDPIAREQEAVNVALAQLTARRQAAVDARAAAAESPTGKLVASKLELQRLQRLAEVAEHQVKVDKVYLEACERYGEDRVMRVMTREGDIVLRAQTEAEEDAAEDRAEAHLRAAGRTPAEQALARRNADLARQLALADTVLTDKAHFDKVAARHHRLWPVLFGARNALVDARVFAEGKDGAR